jgi:hypothetical protein
MQTREIWPNIDMSCKIWSNQIKYYTVYYQEDHDLA